MAVPRQQQLLRNKIVIFRISILQCFLKDQYKSF